MLTPFDVWKISSSFQTARIILSAADLKVFEKLGSGSKSANELARKCGADKRGMAYLLDALSGMSVLDKKGNVYSISKELRCTLSPDSESSILPILKHSAHMWLRWHCLTKVVKNGKPAECLQDIDKEEKESRIAFIGAMHAIAVGRGLAHEIARECRFVSRYRKLLDIGGASGTYSVAFTNLYPKLKATIFDLPEVVPLAKKRIKGTPFSERIDYYAGDFYKDNLPKGHDLALLSAIIHQNSRKENRALYGKIYRALADGGALLIRDHVMNDTRTRPFLGAIFAINMLVATEGGGTYTFKEIKEDLSSAGFKKIRMIRKGDNMDCLVLALK